MLLGKNDFFISTSSWKISSYVTVNTGVHKYGRVVFIFWHIVQTKRNFTKKKKKRAGKGQEKGRKRARKRKEKGRENKGKEQEKEKGKIGKENGHQNYASIQKSTHTETFKKKWSIVCEVASIVFVFIAHAHNTLSFANIYQKNARKGWWPHVNICHVIYVYASWRLLHIQLLSTHWRQTLTNALAFVAYTATVYATNAMMHMK